MKSLDNIQKSAFRRGEYIGWRNSDSAVYLIKRYAPNSNWTAFNRDTIGAPYYSGKTLADISDALKTA
jgi:hypothetical protein